MLVSLDDCCSNYYCIGASSCCKDLSPDRGVDRESVERRIEEMENRDANLYAKAMTEHIAECAEEDNGLQ
ncbi:hypothetical protein Ancab_006423 [Ancistrocladus abbreviatus]